MRLLAGTAVALAACAAVSCALILDFDELTEGDGADGAISCTSDGECNDGDPCTEDRCNTQTNTCESLARTLARIGERKTLTQDIGRAFRLSMTATGARFYLSVFYETPDKSARDVRLHYWDAEGGDYAEGPLLSTQTIVDLSQPASAAALVAGAGLAPRVHAYVAAGTPPAVFHLEMDENLTLLLRSRQAETVPSYDPSVTTRAPVAWRGKDDTIWGSWITTAKTILLHDGSDNQPLPASPVAPFVPVPPPLLVTPLSGGILPGVLWHSADGLFGQLQGSPAPVQITQCNTTGTPSSLSSAFLEFNDAWLAVWTRNATNGPTLESSIVQCSDTGSCINPAPDCVNSPPTRVGTRNGTLAFFQRNAKPSSGYQFAALPAIDSAARSATLSVRLRELLVDADGGASLELELREIANTSLGGQASGPNWPEVAVANENVVSVAWIEPAGNIDVVQWERYRVCYPD